jgi:3'-phosphoadenosine 5'-phosphosulfate synthase
MSTAPPIELYAADKAAATAEAAGLVKVAMNKVSTQWLQCLAEGWASPLKGFMREKEFLQCIHVRQIKNYTTVSVCANVCVELPRHCTRRNSHPSKPLELDATGLIERDLSFMLVTCKRCGKGGEMINFNGHTREM